MNLAFYGAAREVTGSCFLLEINGYSILIDCGLQQGRDVKDYQALPFSGNKIDFVFITHAHIDHSGRLPLLVKNGFKGSILATRATCDLLSIMLRDSAHIQELDARWENHKGKRSGKKPIEPMYTIMDADNTLKLLESFDYNEEIEACEGVTLRFIDAGHLLGSASLLVTLKENDLTKTVVFSGDIGNVGRPIIRDPQYINRADYVVMETTYGNRQHEKLPDYTADLAKIIDDTMQKGGNVIIPSFAIGRTQELLYSLREIKERALVKSNPAFPVYVDSPLASEAIKIYDGDLTGYADEETLKLINQGIEPIKFAGLRITQTTDESRILNDDKTPKLIISASGMCEAGRIRHHLKHNLWREESSIVFVGYQAEGTLGRLIVDGLDKIKLFGEEITIKAQIHNFRALSAHADKDGLLKWIKSFENKVERVFLVHGEEQASISFSEELMKNGIPAHIPEYKEIFNLVTNKIAVPGLKKHEITASTVEPYNSVFTRLLSAGTRLIDVIHKNKNGANKDLARLADQINQLITKWDR